MKSVFIAKPILNKFDFIFLNNMLIHALLTTMLFLKLNFKVHELLEEGFPKICHMGRQLGTAKWDSPRESHLGIVPVFGNPEDFTFQINTRHNVTFFFFRWMSWERGE